MWLAAGCTCLTMKKEKKKTEKKGGGKGSMGKRNTKSVREMCDLHLVSCAQFPCIFLKYTTHIITNNICQKSTIKKKAGATNAIML